MSITDMLPQDSINTGIREIKDPVLQKFLKVLSVEKNSDKISDSLIVENQAEQPKHFFESYTVDSGMKFSIQQVNTKNTDWIYGSFAFLLLIIVILKVAFPIRLRLIFPALVSNNKREHFKHEGYLHQQGFSLLFLLLTAISTGLFLLFILQHFGIIQESILPEDKIYYFLSFSVLVAIVLILKSVTIYIIGIVFNTTAHADDYLSNMLIANYVSTALMIPFIVLYFFSGYSIFLIIILVIYFTITIIKLRQNFIIGMKNALFSHVHLFLYLCTLEILPVLVIWKIVKEYVL